MSFLWSYDTSDYHVFEDSKGSEYFVDKVFKDVYVFDRSSLKFKKTAFKII